MCEAEKWFVDQEKATGQICIGPSHIGSVLRVAYFLVRVETIAELFTKSGPMRQYYYTNIISLYLHVNISSHGIIWLYHNII